MLSGLFIGVIRKNTFLVVLLIVQFLLCLATYLNIYVRVSVNLFHLPVAVLSRHFAPLLDLYLRKKLSVHILRNLLISNLGNASGVKQTLEAFSLSSIDIFYIFVLSIHRSSYYHSLFNYLVVCVFIFEPAVALRCRFFHFQFVCGLLANLR